MKDWDFLAKALFEFSYWHDAIETPFKPQAYMLASESVTALKGLVKKTWKKGGIKALKKLPGIGEHIAKKIDEYFRTGKIKEYDQMKKRYPVDIAQLAKIESIGPKTIYQLWKELRVTNLMSLKKALRDGKVQSIKGFEKKRAEKLLREIDLTKRASGRLQREKVLPTADLIIKRLKALKAVQRVSLAGSLRRKKPDVGDIDIIATSSKPKEVMEAFMHFPEVETVLGKGLTRTSVRLTLGIDCDIRVVSNDVYGAALQYFTGDKRHNIIMRTYAEKKGYKLNEYGLFKKGKLVACKTEKAIYDALGLKMPPPEKRLGENEFYPLNKKAR